MENITTQKIGQLSKNLMMGMTDRTICTTPQPPMITTMSKTSCSTVFDVLHKDRTGHGNTRTQKL